MQFALNLAVVLLIFLNGATDASNAAASAVTSGALRMRQAAILSALCNTAGGLAGGLLFPGVRRAVTELADFGEAGTAGVLASVSAACLFTFAAWLLRLPTSESHALLSSAAGVSCILGNTVSPLSLLLSPVFWMLCGTVAAFLLGIFAERFFPHTIPPRTLRILQILSAAAASFLHGVQDLAKFLALLSLGGAGEHPAAFPLCAAVLGFGTLCGGRRMTEAVGEKLAVLRERNALASDFAGAASLLLLSLLGVPASTTHARNAAAAGCALLSPDCRLRKKQFLRFTAVWILTFPVCAALGVLSTLILRRIF